MSTAMAVIFWLLAAALLYAWFGYAGCLAALALVRRRRSKRGPTRMTVSFIVPVHNGGDLIMRKIENLRALDYPTELVEMIVVDDCSTDDTPSLVLREAAAASSIRVIRLSARSGKAAALNAGLDIASGEIIGFTDVAGLLLSDALTAAMESFADPAVGCVSSEDDVMICGGVAGGEGLYTRIDSLIRRLESATCSATGMNGSFYLVRHELCPPFPLDVATDMFSALHCVGSGFRAVVDERSKVRLSAQHDASKEFERKVRTMVTGMHSLRAFKRLLNPLRFGLFSLFLLSHKVLRYLTPVLIGLMLGSAGYLAFESRFYSWLVLGMTASVSIGLARILSQHCTARACAVLQSRFAGLMAFVCVSAAAAAVGWYRYLAGKRYPTWQPTERSAV